MIVRTSLTCTILGDGSSDRGLVPIVEWVLAKHCRVPFVVRFAEQVGGGKLADRCTRAAELYPCNLLFVHRDAERVERAIREQEILRATRTLTTPATPVVPVRMTEAWLLSSEVAIRSACGNPNCRTKLDLPSLRDVERIPDPKECLFALLREASGLTGRRLRRFDVHGARNRVAERTDDFTVLIDLPAFSRFVGLTVETLILLGCAV